MLINRSTQKLDHCIIFQAAAGNKATPLLQCHGDCDPIVPYKWGQATATLLKGFMSRTEFKTYRGVMHSSCDEVRFTAIF